MYVFNIKYYKSNLELKLFKIYEVFTVRLKRNYCKLYAFKVVLVKQKKVYLIENIK